MKRRLTLVIALGVIVGPLSFASVASASYNGSAAASYADLWAQSFNYLVYNTFPSDDCTNFVSQAMASNGFPIVRGLWTNTNTFYNDTLANYNNSPTLQSEDGREESVSATVADDLFNYFLAGSGTLVGSYSYPVNGPAPS